MSCPLPLMHSNVGLIVSHYLRDHPDVRVHVEATNRRVDLVEEGFDVAIRVRSPPLEDSGLAIRPLDTADTALVASPSLFTHRPRPTHPSELSQFATLTMDPSRRAPHVALRWRPMARWCRWPTCLGS